MPPSAFFLSWLRVDCRAFIRAHGNRGLVAIAALIGAVAGLLVVVMGAAVDVLHAMFFDLATGERLSARLEIDPVRALVVPTLGGFVLGIALLMLLRRRPGREIDPVEANALHGGHMSLRGSVIVALQTIWSSGVGASVGLEAGYTQISSGVAAAIGRAFRLRRVDQRLMVGCGAAAAIAGAFGAPLGGAFYAFELIVGGYTPASLTPIGVAAIVGYAVARAFAPLPLGVVISQVGEVHGHDLAIAGVLGLAAALFGIVIMRGVALSETLLAKARLWPPLRPALGGLVVGLLALVTPQVMSSGHGALHVTAMTEMPLAAIATVFILKALASIVSLGSGFRGGLFFASLLLGALGGHLFAAASSAIWPGPELDPDIYAIIGARRIVHLGDRRTVDHVLHCVGDDGQSVDHHRGAGRGHRLHANDARAVRLFVRHVAVSSARRNHPQRRRCRLASRPHGADHDAGRRRHGECRHCDRRLPHQVPARLEDAGRRPG